MTAARSHGGRCAAEERRDRNGRRAHTIGTNTRRTTETVRRGSNSAGRPRIVNGTAADERQRQYYYCSSIRCTRIRFSSPVFSLIGYQRINIAVAAPQNGTNRIAYAPCVRLSTLVSTTTPHYRLITADSRYLLGYVITGFLLL